MVDRKDKRFFDFMCSCSKNNGAVCDKVYEEVMAEFKESYSAVTDKDFIDCICHRLSYMKNGSANIEHIYSDMWSGIAAKYTTWDNCDCDEDCSHIIEQSFWVECDRLYHGLARLYQLVKAYDESLS